MKTFNLPDSAYQFWKPFHYRGKQRNLDHLCACKHEFIHPERDERYLLYFTFSHHVFTRKHSGTEVIDEIEIYPFPPEDLRVFDLARYELSLHLPSIIKTLPDQFCYHGGYSRYCTCKINNKDGSKQHYQVVYRVWKERGKLRFHIESAYPLRERLGKVKKISFWVICHNLLTGKRMPKPSN